MEVRILGSSRMLNPLKTDVVPTIFSHQTFLSLYAFPVSHEQRSDSVWRYVCVVISSFLAQLLSCGAWLVKKPTTF